MATDSTNEPGAANEELPGLAPLGRLDQVMVKQQIEIAELALGVERRNRYRIMDTNEDIIYYAIEDTELTNRVLFGSYRSFKLPIFTEDRTQVLLFSRPLACSCCCCFCCLQILTVSLPSGTVLGYVRQQWDPFRVNYHVENANRQVIFKILGPMITCRLFGDVNIQVDYVYFES
ncbi:phospholipid scramblase family member 5-like isoform X2 [Choristoneura fumiferana]|uniref:phospholipid scramblase family member 5-like isoform X2 n=1 Tax=Choristoneura fumiferana TaxID=7141 RepID=UPI003D15B407